MGADEAYEGPRVEQLAQQTGIEVEGGKRSDQDKGFVVQPERWMVERTLAWLSRKRRLSKDYERKEECSQAFIYLGMSRLMLDRLARVPCLNTLSAHRCGLDARCFSNAPRVRDSLQALSAQVMSLANAQRHPLDFAQHGERLRGFLGEAGQRLDEEAGHMDPVRQIHESKPFTAT